MSRWIWNLSLTWVAWGQHLRVINIIVGDKSKVIFLPLIVYSEARALKLSLTINIRDSFLPRADLSAWGMFPIKIIAKKKLIPARMIISFNFIESTNGLYIYLLWVNPVFLKIHSFVSLVPLWDMSITVAKTLPVSFSSHLHRRAWRQTVWLRMGKPWIVVV